MGGASTLFIKLAEAITVNCRLSCVYLTSVNTLNADLCKQYISEFAKAGTLIAIKVQAFESSSVTVERCIPPALLALVEYNNTQRELELAKISSKQ